MNLLVTHCTKAKYNVFISEVDTDFIIGYIHVPPSGHNGNLKLAFNIL